MNQIKQGYKQTKVGVIPEEWEVYSLKDIAKIIDSLHQTPEFSDNGYPMIRVTDIKAGNLDLSNTMKVSSEIFKEFTRQYVPKKTDIVLSRVGSYGVSSFVNTNEQFCLGQNTVIISPKQHQKFLYYSLNSALTKIQIDSYSYGSGYKSLSLKNIQDLIILLPPLKEQEKIAEILTTWDEAITKQTELLEAKELLKKALMQKLLSGEVRFSGFSGEWEEVRLGEIGSSFNGLSGKTSEDFGTGEAKYITYKNIFDNSKIKLDIFENVQISDDEKQNLVKFGDIFFTVSSETPEEVGMSSVLLDNVSNTYLNSFCFGYRLNNFNTLNPYFARFYFRSFQMRDKISRLAQGSTRFNLSKNEIIKLEIKLPSLPEQQKIAEVLSLADEEINLLKNSLEELKLQKKALMQKLLTGQVRVKV